MMNVSLDTDVVIHLYKSGRKDLLFTFFDELFMYEYLLEKELKYKASDVYEEFTKDVIAGKIKIITKADLAEMGIKRLFEGYIERNECLFDQGELHAIALAQAMGIAAFVSDDTKMGGPHEILVREIIEDVIPFAFYELLFLKYLNSEIEIEEMLEEFQAITSASMQEHPMSFRSKILSVVRRFKQECGTKRDNQWLENYCERRNIHLKEKMLGIKNFIKNL